LAECPAPGVGVAVAVGEDDLAGRWRLSFAAERQVLLVAMRVAHMQEIRAQLGVATAPIGIVVGVSVINAAFEEIFVSGYVITALKPLRGPTFALNVSVAIRVLYHLYQGQLGVLSVLPLGLIFAYWYVRTGRLWPLVVAHAIADIVALAAYA